MTDITSNLLVTLHVIIATNAKKWTIPAIFKHKHFLTKLEKERECHLFIYLIILFSLWNFYSTE